MSQLTEPVAHTFCTVGMRPARYLVCPSVVSGACMRVRFVTVSLDTPTVDSVFVLGAIAFSVTQFVRRVLSTYVFF